MDVKLMMVMMMMVIKCEPVVQGHSRVLILSVI